METTTATALTAASFTMFRTLAADANNWGGTPMLPELDADEKGNLTDLKRKKLLTVEKSDGCLWVYFTPAGLALASELGFEIETF